MIQERGRSFRSRATAPKSAAIAGIVFSILFFVSIGLLLTALPTNVERSEINFSVSKSDIQMALNLIPFASIAFLWFMGVVRDRFGAQEDQFFGTVFLGSGLLLIAMLFVSSAIIASLIFLHSNEPNPVVASAYYKLGFTLAHEITTNYTIKMIGVFMISTSSLFLRTRVIPRWLAFLGYGLAAIMILRIGYINQLGWVILSFPLWILLLSIYILIDNYQKQQGIKAA